MHLGPPVHQGVVPASHAVIYQRRQRQCSPQRPSHTLPGERLHVPCCITHQEQALLPQRRRSSRERRRALPAAMDPLGKRRHTGRLQVRSHRTLRRSVPPHEFGVESGGGVEAVILLAHQTYVSRTPHHHVYGTRPVACAAPFQDGAHPHAGPSLNRGGREGADHVAGAQAVQSRCGHHHPGTDVLLPLSAPDREGPFSVAHGPQFRRSSLYEHDAPLYGGPDQRLIQGLSGQRDGPFEGHMSGPPPSRHPELGQPWRPRSGHEPV